MVTKKQFIHRLGLSILTLGEKYFRVPDVARAEARGAKMGMLLHALDKKHRTQTYANLRTAFPDLDETTVKERAKEMFRHFGRIVADFIRSPIRTDYEISELTDVDGKENLDLALAEGNGVLLVTGHLGNWERMGHWLRHNGIRISAVARDANESLITDKVNAIRGHKGMEILSRGNAAREIIKRLRANEMIGILPDQNADEAYIPFFGKPAGTVLGPAVLHLRTKAPILPAAHLRIGPGKYRLVFFPPLHAMPDETPEALMTRVNQALEELIRLAPEQYLWMHDRWRFARRRGLL